MQITTNVTVPLYYTGLTTTATLTPGDATTAAAAAVAAGEEHTLRRDYSVVVEMTIEASGYAWWVVDGPAE